MGFNYPLTNNVVLKVKALDCYEQNRYFRDFQPYGSASLFYENCVEVRKGKRPEIRLHSNGTFFNITNNATFENIEFTGIDMLAT
jgi:hypothetical protein